MLIVVCCCAETKIVTWQALEQLTESTGTRPTSVFFVSCELLVTVDLLFLTAVVVVGCCLLLAVVVICFVVSAVVFVLVGVAVGVPVAMYMTPGIALILS